MHVHTLCEHDAVKDEGLTPIGTRWIFTNRARLAAQETMKTTRMDLADASMTFRRLVHDGREEERTGGDGQWILRPVESALSLASSAGSRLPRSFSVNTGHLSRSRTCWPTLKLITNPRTREHDHLRILARTNMVQNTDEVRDVARVENCDSTITITSGMQMVNGWTHSVYT